MRSVRADACRKSHSFCKAQIRLWKTEPEPLCQSVRWIVQVPKLHSTCVACKDAQSQGTSDSVTCRGVTCPLACQLPRSSPVGAVRGDTLCSHMHCTSAICPSTSQRFPRICRSINGIYRKPGVALGKESSVALALYVHPEES